MCFEDAEPEAAPPVAPGVFSAAGTLIDILRFAPPTLRTCSLAPAPQALGAVQRCVLKVELYYSHQYEDASEHPGAAKLAEALQPYADAANIGLQLDEESQVICLSRASDA